MTADEPAKIIVAQEGFSVALRPDNIIVVTLEDMRRQTIELWMNYVRTHDGKMRAPVRLLYDLRKSGPPSRFLLDVIGPFMSELTIPADTRNAYVYERGPYASFSDSFVRRMPAKAGDVRTFTDFEQAVKWLSKTDNE